MPNPSDPLRLPPAPDAPHPRPTGQTCSPAAACKRPRLPAKTPHPRTAPWPTSLWLSALEMSKLRRHVAGRAHPRHFAAQDRSGACRGDRTRRACRAQPTEFGMRQDQLGPALKQARCHDLRARREAKENRPEERLFLAKSREKILWESGCAAQLHSARFSLK